MPIRSAISPFHSAVLVLAVLAGLIYPVSSRAGEPVALGLDAARELAVEALRNNDPGLAIGLARGLLQAEPNDFVAYYILGSAQAQLNRPQQSRKAAARAFRLGDTKTARFRSAQLAAQMAYREQRYSLSQFWLRRAAVHAPDAAAKAVVARDYKILRQINPWSFRVQTDLRPSSNVNKGADTALQIIDGVPVTGVLSGAARALSGVIGSVDVAASYRLDQTATSATSILGRLFVQRVALSADARGQAPTASDSDFASTFAEASLRHGFAVGPAEKRGSASVELTLGEAWYGGDRSFRFARLGGDRTWRQKNGATWQLSALYESRFMAVNSVNKAEILGLGGEWSRPLANGDRLILSFALRDTQADHPNGTYWSGSVRSEYQWARPVGPARLSAGLILGYSDYPDFISAGLFTVPGGRQDGSAYADISATFYKIEYAGFAPVLRLRAGQKKSNDSRYSLKEVSLSLGIQSNF
ncbi:MAG: tetratricopeptide repeat protein [Marinibacterium sp.]